MNTPNNPFGPEMDRYWARRYDLFSKWDEGVRFDREALFSIKPEIAAAAIIGRVETPVVIDGMCGVGGVAIMAARMGKAVHAIELDAQRLDFAISNAALYAVGDQISWTNGDALVTVAEVANTEPRPKTLYLDPPWGGPDYYKKQRFLFSDFAPDIRSLIAAFLETFGPVVVALPVNFDLNELRSLTDRFDLVPSTIWGRVAFLNAILHRA